MKIKLCTGFLAIFSLLAASNLPAVETGTVVGEGAKECRQFSKASRSKENEFIIWVQGYVSAYNSIAPDINNVTEGKTFFWVLNELKQFCKANPEAYFNDAVVDLMKRLHPQGIRIGDPTKIKISEN